MDTAIGLTITFLAALVAGRALVWVIDSWSRRGTHGWRLVEVRTNTDLSPAAIASQRKRITPLATRVWENPESGERKEVLEYWP